MDEDIARYLPLSNANLCILLSLSDESRHGYGIMQEIAKQSGGGFRLGPGTLYDNLRKLLDNGMVEETGILSPDDDPRRRYYRLSDFGHRVLQAEIARLESLVRRARLHLRTERG